MAKNSGIRALKNLKNKISQKDPPVKTQRIVVTKKPEKDSTVTDPVASILDVEKPEFMEHSVDYLEESPVSGKLENASDTDKSDSPGVSVEKPAPATRSSRTRRRKKSVFSRWAESLFSVFNKRNSSGAKTSDALAFASNNRRLGRKGRRNRMIFLYAGTGLAVVVVLLIVFLVPGGVAAPAEAGVTSGNQAALVGAQVSPEASVTPTTTGGQAVTSPTPSASATSSDNTIAAVSDPLEMLTETPTEMPTESPTEAPTEEPTPIPTTAADPTQTPIDMNELAEYFVVKADAYYNDMGYSNNHYNYTEDEFYILARIIDIEARGESYEGKVAVGNVVMNRVLCRSFPGNSITEVVTRPGQFAYSGNESRNPSSSSKRAARAILDDELWVIPQDVYYFRSGAPANENWGSHKFYTKIGGHCFYLHSYSGRHRGGDAPPALFERTYKYAQYGCKPEKRVYRIQYMLNKLGYDVYADSYFGEGTKIALMDFQGKKGMEADGVAGPATVKALIKEFGVENYYQRFVK